MSFPLPSSPSPFDNLPNNGDIITSDRGRYFIGDPIGAGAFGKVFACTDEWDNSLVAKVLLSIHQPYEEVRTRWARESTFLVGLRHPNITYIYDAFEYNNAFYIIIERCSIPLSSILAIENLRGDFWLPHIARDLLHGLDYIHRNGCVHKDIHAGNIFSTEIFDRMLPSNDPVWMFKIGDLGISILEKEINLSATMAKWMLPPEYLKPEEFGQVDRRVDFYHTGLLLLNFLYNGCLKEFSHDEILEGLPRKMAEAHHSPYGQAISLGLRRHVDHRPNSAFEYWHAIKTAVPNQ